MAETLDALKNLAKKIFGTHHEVVTPAGTGLQRPVTAEMAEFDRNAVRHDRRTKITDCTKMGAVDARVARMYFKLSADAFVGKFSVKIEQAMNEAIKEKAQQDIDGIVERCKVLAKGKGWIKSMLREGDLFWEVVVNDADRRIDRLKKLAAIITFSNMDSSGNFPENKPAYRQEHPLTQQTIRTFEGWQIVQISWAGEDGRPYGEPLFAAARLAYQRLDGGEKNVTVRRAVRAGKKLHHSVGSEDRPSNWEAVQRYKEENKDTLNKPLNPVQDYFSDGRVTITEVGGDATLGDMADITHFEGLLFMLAGIPPALLGGGREKSVNRDILKEMEEDFFRVITDINDLLEAGLRKVFDFQLLLSGVNDESVKYTFKWGAKDRDDVDKKIARALELQKLGFSFQTILSVCDLEGIDFEEEMERVHKQVEDGIVPYGLGLKLDPTILALLGAGGGAAPPAVKGEQLLENIEKIRIGVEKHLGGNASPESMKQILALSKGGKR